MNKLKKDFIKMRSLKEKNVRRTGSVKKIKLPSLSHHLSIRGKLIFAFAIPIVFIILLGAVSFQKAADSIENNYQASTGQTISMTGEYIRFGLESILDTSTEYTADKTISSYFSGLYSNDASEENAKKNDIKTAAIAKCAANEFVGAVYFLSDSVDPIIYTQKSMPVIEKGIFQGFLETAEGALIEGAPMQSIWVGSDAYLDEKLNTASDDYAMRFIRKFHGSNTLLVIDVSKEAITDIMENMKFQGALAVVTADGKEISGNSVQDFHFVDQDFYQNALAGEKESNSSYVTYQGEEYLFSYSKIGETNAMICAMMPKSMITRQTDGIKQVTVIVVLIACLVAVVIGAGISNGIVKTIKNIIKGLKKASQGDLTVEFHTKRKDEYKYLIEEIQHTFSNMKDLILQVDVLSHIVSDSTEGVTATSQLFLTSTEHISSAINEIEQGVMQQAAEAGECLSQMDNLSKQIETVNDKNKEIEELTNSTKLSIGEGTACTDKLNEQTRSTIRITTDIIRKVEQLEKKIHAITEITNVIDDISNQTSLLSLNASIEAARAGQFGRGFSVVADEIRNLAEKSKNSVSDIGKIIQSIQSDTTIVADTAREAESVLGLQKTAVENTNISYKVINENVEQLVVNQRNISEHIEDIEKARISTLGSIENISAVLQEIAASTNSVNQSADGQLHSVEELTQSSNTLSQNAEELLVAIKKFTI